MSFSNLKIVASGSITAFIGRFIGTALNYFYSILLARYLGVRLMGVFFLGITILNILSNFVMLGLDQSLLKFVSISLSQSNYTKAKKLIVFSIKIILIFSIILGVFLFLFKKTLSIYIFHDEVLNTVFVFIAIILPIFSLYTLLSETLKAFKKIALVVFSQNFIFPVITISTFLGLYFLGLRLKAALMAYLIGSLVTVFLIVHFYKMLLIKEDMKNVIINKKELFSVSIPVYWVSIMTIFMWWTDIIMLGIFETPKEIGIYTAATKTAAFVAFFLMAVNYILPPIVAQLYSKRELNELELLVRRTARWNLIFSLLVTSIFFLFGKEILSLYGKEFTLAYIPLLLLSFGQIINAGVGSVGYILVMTGFQNKLVYISSAAAILNVILNAILISLFSIKGAALATGITLIVWNLTAAYFVYKDVKIKAFSDSFMKIIIGVFLIVLVSLLIKKFIGLWGCMAAFLLISLFATFKIFLDNADIFLVKTIINRSV